MKIVAAQDVVHWQAAAAAVKAAASWAEDAGLKMNVAVVDAGSFVWDFEFDALC